MDLTTITLILHTERNEIDKATLSFERLLNIQTAERTAQSVVEIIRSKKHLRIISELHPFWSASDYTWEREQIKLAVVAMWRPDRVAPEVGQTCVAEAEQGRAYGSS